MHVSIVLLSKRQTSLDKQLTNTSEQTRITITDLLRKSEIYSQRLAIPYSIHFNHNCAPKIQTKAHLNVSRYM